MLLILRVPSFIIRSLSIVFAVMGIAMNFCGISLNGWAETYERWFGFPPPFGGSINKLDDAP